MLLVLYDMCCISILGVPNLHSMLLFIEPQVQVTDFVRVVLLHVHAHIRHAKPPDRRTHAHTHELALLRSLRICVHYAAAQQRGDIQHLQPPCECVCECSLPRMCNIRQMEFRLQLYSQAQLFGFIAVT